MYITDQKRIIYYGILALVIFLLMTACNAPIIADNSTPTPAQPSLVQGTSLASTPGVGPTVILTPTIVSNGNAHSQLVTLSDRILIISSISKQAGADSSSLAISLTMTIKNTGAKTIMNEAMYFQLTGADGDTFGVQSGANSEFFTAIAPQSSRTGTIVFQIPVGATNGLRLMYRPEVATETVFVPLNP
jgi:Domain of unknown function (DUF4352)